ncbi:MAG TPA: DUF6766 family protein [Allosphingosinicella sp.]|jgi:hypothetical protein
MAKLFKNNGLTIVLLALFLVTILGQWIAGWHVENEELLRHGGEAISLGAYLVDPAFLSSVFENWESEFLQMSAYVVLTAMLIQRGSAESRDPDDPPRDSGLERQSRDPGAPKILSAGRLARALYARSLGTALFALFLLSFLLHWSNSAAAAAAEAKQHGEAAVGPLAYLGGPQLWFESFQNWQSEFLSTAVLIVLSIWLRQRESPESKAVAAPNDATGAA